MKSSHLSKSLPAFTPLPKSNGHKDSLCPPQLQEEFHQYPLHRESNDANTCSLSDANTNDGGKIHITNSYSKHRSLPLPIPADSARRQEERDEELHQELTDVYNHATWKMYHRIKKAREERIRNGWPRE